LYDLLLPYQGRVARTGFSYSGAVDRSLGRLATVLGQYDTATAYLAAAQQIHERMGAPLFLARTWADQATLALARADTSESRFAHELVERGIELAQRYNAPGVVQYVGHALERA